MKSSRKFYSLLALVLIMTVLISGCAGGSQSGEDSKQYAKKRSKDMVELIISTAPVLLGKL